MPLLLLLASAIPDTAEVNSFAPLFLRAGVEFALDPPWTDERLDVSAAPIGMATLTPGDPTPAGNTYEGVVIESAGGLWWDHVHVLPRAIRLGNIVANTDVDIDIFNAYRAASRDFTAFLNGAGAGTSFATPSLPVTFGPLEGATYIYSISLDGPAAVDDFLVFTFDDGDVNVPISFTRAVVFHWRPMTPVVERLQFVTSVLEHKDGTEQRHAMRLAPRQVVEFPVDVDDGVRRQKLVYTTAGWRQFAVPMWHEAVALTAAVTTGATSIPVETDVQYSDIRGACFIWLDDDTYETAVVDSVVPGTVTLSSGTQGSYPAGALLMPLRVGMLADIRGDQHPVNLEIFQARFTLNDNDVDLADASAFPTHGGRVVLGSGNIVQGTLARASQARVSVIDSVVGRFDFVTHWRVAKPSRAWSFATRSRRARAELRGLLHHLRGRQVSFHAATSFMEMTPTQDLGSGSTSLYIANAGYARYVGPLPPFNTIRVKLVDGTEITRDVTAAAELSVDEDQLTVTPAWAANVDKDDIVRIELLERVRGDSDEIVVVHRSSLGDAEATMPIKGVLS